jgi:hypothetical protein
MVVWSVLLLVAGACGLAWSLCSAVQFGCSVAMGFKEDNTFGLVAGLIIGVGGIIGGMMVMCNA